MATIAETSTGSSGRMKFIVGGALILAAVVYLIVSSTIAGAQFFQTINELNAAGVDMVGKPVKVTGAVIGDTIVYDPNTLTLEFTVAHVPADNEMLEQEGGLAEALHAAVMDPTRQKLQVVYVGPMPDLLQHEAQAIMTGKLGEDGIFYAEELLLKCPTRYDEALPEQAES